MSLRTSSALLLPLLLTLGACGGETPGTEDESVTVALDEPNAAAPTTPRTDGSEAASAPVANYRLTEADLQRWIEVMQSPEQRAADDGDTDEESLRLIIENNPAYRAVVEGAGLTAERFETISHVVIAAVAAIEAERAGMDGDSLARATGIDPANVGLVADHEAEVREPLEM